MRGWALSGIEIIGFELSVYVRAIRLACEEKGIAYRLVPDRPHEGAAARLHPFGKIPVLRDGEFVLCESRAIASYLEDSFGGPPLFPRDRILKARTEEWISFVNTTIDPMLIRRYFVEFVLPTGQGAVPNREVIDMLVPAMRQQIAVIDRTLEATGWLAGPDLTFADLNLYPVLVYFRESPDGAPMFETAPALSDFMARMDARASVKTVFA